MSKQQSIEDMAREAVERLEPLDAALDRVALSNLVETVPSTLIFCNDDLSHNCAVDLDIERDYIIPRVVVLGD